MPSFQAASKSALTALPLAARGAVEWLSGVGNKAVSGFMGSEAGRSFASLPPAVTLGAQQAPIWAAQKAPQLAEAANTFGPALAVAVPALSAARRVGTASLARATGAVGTGIRYAAGTLPALVGHRNPILRAQYKTQEFRDSHPIASATLSTRSPVISNIQTLRDDPSRRGYARQYGPIAEALSGTMIDGIKVTPGMFPGSRDYETASPGQRAVWDISTAKAMNPVRSGGSSGVDKGLRYLYHGVIGAVSGDYYRSVVAPQGQRYPGMIQQAESPTVSSTSPFGQSWEQHTANRGKTVSTGRAGTYRYGRR